MALGAGEKLSRDPSEAEWQQLFDLAQKQAVAGVAFLALDRLSSYGQKIPSVLLFEWIGLGEQIKSQNLLVNQRCKEITQLFRNEGFESCILKGQGNARMYPVPESRLSGDIDIWVFGERDEITKFVKERCPNVFEQYHHIDFPIFEDVPVEVHYTPGKLLSPRYNRRFQKWCQSEGLKVKGERLETIDGYNVPSVGFNAVFQMAHMMIHFFIEGIGLRHFVDYYYVLTNTDFTNHTDTVETIQYLGLEKFARGVMWIEQYCLGLEDGYLLFEPSEKIGRVILKEMEEGGNFGQYDQRYKGREDGYLMRGLMDSYRLIKMGRVFPKEVSWKIYRKLENQRWQFVNR